MRVAIVHYHLRAGGVTRIIQHAVSAIRSRDGDVVVVSGEPPPAGLDIGAPVCVEPALQYAGGADVSTAEIVTRIDAAAGGAFGGEPDIWHVHNHALGKNVLVPRLVHAWSRQGRRLLLQIHDFAEDGRPQNYRLLWKELGHGDARQMSQVLYPLSGGVHYAVVNGRDRAFLCASGAPASHLHLLPNPIVLAAETGVLPRQPTGAPHYVYPTRAIRRKNLGEFLLWSAVTDPPATFGVTLAPENPAERLHYERWVELAGALKLPVEFGVGINRPFGQVLREARGAVTTSVAEGFGMAYLEPWLVGRPVLGRSLPEITHEFEMAGVDLSALYERLDVPLAWVGRGALRTRIEEALSELLAAYDRPMSPDQVDRAWNAMVTDDRVDFGRLDAPFQAEVIRRLAASRDERSELSPPALGTACSESTTTMERNREAILRGYNLEAYAERLDSIYHAIRADAPASRGAVDGEALLDRFLAPDRFCLLRS